MLSLASTDRHKMGHRIAPSQLSEEAFIGQSEIVLPIMVPSGAESIHGTVHAVAARRSSSPCNARTPHAGRATNPNSSFPTSPVQFRQSLFAYFLLPLLALGIFSFLVVSDHPFFPFPVRSPAYIWPLRYQSHDSCPFRSLINSRCGVVHGQARYRSTFHPSQIGPLSCFTANI